MPDDSPSPKPSLRYRRVILKLSGESLCRSGERGISGDEVQAIAAQIKAAHESGCQIAIVIGGGNILRGAQFSGANACVQNATAHYMGMLATVINSLAMQDALEAVGCQTRVMSAVRVDTVAETFIRRRAIRHLEKGRVVVLAAAIGSPFVTSDTAGAQRALELAADVVLKKLKVMDATAIALCEEHGTPILVFNFKQQGNIVRAISGETTGTWIGPKK